MQLDNYSDLSASGSALNAGFQFEFHCAHCSQRWKSPFKPYRAGQFMGLMGRVGYFINSVRHATYAPGRLVEWRSDGARASALAEAQALAARHYVACDSCSKIVCRDCFNQAENACQSCLENTGHGGHGHAGASASEATTSRGRASPACPNCNTASDGGRFCAECGFDMASTHKSCPGCGSLCERQTRFCGDCGHGF